MTPRRLLVTGATGLIGSEFIARLGKLWEITAVIRPGSKGCGRQDVRTVCLDLNSHWDTSDLPTRIDAVVHLAQSEHFRNFPDRAVDIFSVNTACTLRLLDYAHRAGAASFVLASSGGIYGHSSMRLSEDIVIPHTSDLGFYLNTKLCAEVLAHAYSDLLSLSILRFFFVYGPSQRRDMLIPRLIDSVRTGRPIRLQGVDGIRINPTYVADAAWVIEQCLSQPESLMLNVGGPDNLSIRSICDTIGTMLGQEPVYDIHADESPRHLVADITALTRLFGPPQTRFPEGLRFMLPSPPISGADT